MEKVSFEPGVKGGSASVFRFLPSNFVTPPVGSKNLSDGSSRLWEKFDDMYNRLDTIPALDRETD